MSIPKDEYAKISHTIATYPKKIERGHVFTENNYYLCTNIDNNGNFTVVASLPIEGNEEQINILRRNAGRAAVIPIKNAEDALRFIGAVRSRGGRVSWDYARSQRFGGGTGGNATLSMGQQTEPRGDRQEVGGNGTSETRVNKGKKFFRTSRGEAYGHA